MKPGMTLINKQTFEASSQEIQLIKEFIRDYHIKTVTDWISNQKQKNRIKFVNFLSSLKENNNNSTLNSSSSSLTERIAKDIIKNEFHSRIFSALQENIDDYNDVLNLLSIHMSRSNVLASAPSKKDPMPKLLKEMYQEDHLFETKRRITHVNPPTKKIEYQQAIPKNVKAISAKSNNERTCPFASFPNTKLETTSQSQYVPLPIPEKPKQVSVFNVLNTPTCL